MAAILVSLSDISEASRDRAIAHVCDSLALQGLRPLTAAEIAAVGQPGHNRSM